MYKEILAKSALHKLNSKWLPYKWDLNIYRGCSHNCQYCYALYSHSYLETEDFFKEVFVKTNVVELLDKELSSRSWKKEVINLGGVCDSYQQAEEKYQLMPRILELFLKHKQPFIVSTKSKLILKDIELISKIAEQTYVNVAVTITTTDETIVKNIETGASSATDRFDVLREFSKTKTGTGCHIMPIMPFLTDSRENLESIFKKASECNVDYVLTGLLNLKTKTRKNFMATLQKYYQDIFFRYKELYSYSDRERYKVYKKKIKTIISQLYKKYGLTPDYIHPMEKIINSAEQLKLF